MRGIGNTCAKEAAPLVWVCGTGARRSVVKSRLNT